MLSQTPFYLDSAPVDCIVQKGLAEAGLIAGAFAFPVPREVNTKLSQDMLLKQTVGMFQQLLQEKQEQINALEHKLAVTKFRSRSLQEQSAEEVDKTANRQSVSPNTAADINRLVGSIGALVVTMRHGVDQQNPKQLEESLDRIHTALGALSEIQNGEQWQLVREPLATMFSNICTPLQSSESQTDIPRTAMSDQETQSDPALTKAPRAEREQSTVATQTNVVSYVNTASQLDSTRKAEIAVLAKAEHVDKASQLGAIPTSSEDFQSQFDSDLLQEALRKSRFQLTNTGVQTNADAKFLLDKEVQCGITVKKVLVDRDCQYYLKVVNSDTQTEIGAFLFEYENNRGKYTTLSDLKRSLAVDETAETGEDSESAHWKHMASQTDDSSWPAAHYAGNMEPIIGITNGGNPEITQWRNQVAAAAGSAHLQRINQDNAQNVHLESTTGYRLHDGASMFQLVQAEESSDFSSESEQASNAVAHSYHDLDAISEERSTLITTRSASVDQSARIERSGYKERSISDVLGNTVDHGKHKVADAEISTDITTDNFDVIIAEELELRRQLYEKARKIDRLESRLLECEQALLTAGLYEGDFLKPEEDYEDAVGKLNEPLIMEIIDCKLRSADGGSGSGDGNSGAISARRRRDDRAEWVKRVDGMIAELERAGSPDNYAKSDPVWLNESPVTLSDYNYRDEDLEQLHHLIQKGSDDSEIFKLIRQHKQLLQKQYFRIREQTYINNRLIERLRWLTSAKSFRTDELVALKQTIFALSNQIGELILKCDAMRRFKEQAMATEREFELFKARVKRALTIQQPGDVFIDLDEHDFVVTDSGRRRSSSPMLTVTISNLIRV